MKREASLMGLDRELALSRVGGDLELLKEIAAIFVAEAPKMIAEITGAIASGDHELLERAAHSMKGAAANFGAQSVVSAALRLETMGRQHDVAGLDDALQALQSVLPVLQHELESLRDS